MMEGHPLMTACHDDDAPFHSMEPLPAIVPVAFEEKKQEQQPTPSLPEDALVEILSRVPYRSLCRFKCVSKPWLTLCSSQDIRKRSSQTLSGFFYIIINGLNMSLHFRNLNGRGPPLVDPSLPFLHTTYKHIFFQQVCGGLLLCSCLTFAGRPDHVVCNPATEELTVLPPPGYPGRSIPVAFLGFDTVVPYRFVVFALQILGVHDARKVAIYSSETGQWAYVQSKWASPPPVLSKYTRVFLNGTMHFITSHNSIATVDMEGKVWRMIKMPDDLPGCCDVGQSQGRLYAWKIDNSHGCQLYIWVLEDYGNGKWSLKHNVNVLELFGRHCRQHDGSCVMFAIHPDCNVIFLTNKEKMTLSYDMDNQKVHVICTEFMDGLPYVPFFGELPSATGH